MTPSKVVKLVIFSAVIAAALGIMLQDDINANVDLKSNFMRTSNVVRERPKLVSKLFLKRVSFQYNLIEYWGYQAEEHTLTTKDGYILTNIRIANKNHPNPKETPVLLGHCLIGSSAYWAFGPPENSLAYILSDQGYDVWLINARGSQYSKSHEYIDSSSPEFWSFGMEESALFDYPQTIDYILEQTKTDQVN